LPWNQCESVRPLAVDSDKADRLLGYGNACCGYSTGNDVIDGVMPGYFSTSAPHLQEWATQTLQPIGDEAMVDYNRRAAHLQ